MEKTAAGFEPAKNVSIRSDGNFYGMKIAGVPVTNANKGDILGDGVFEYLPDCKTLLVSGNCTTDYPVIEVENNSQNDVYPLTVNVEDRSVFTGNKHGGISLSRGETTITGAGLLSIIAPTSGGISLNDNASVTLDEASVSIQSKYGITGCAEFVMGTEESLTVTHSYLDIKAESGQPAISQLRGDGLVLNSCGFTNSGLRIMREEFGDWAEFVADADGNYASEVRIQRNDENITNYGLFIGGVEVTSYNKDDVLHNGVFSYDDQKKILSVKDSFKTKSNNVIYSKMNSELTINFYGDCNLDNSDDSNSIAASTKYPIYITAPLTNDAVTMKSIWICNELSIENMTLNLTGSSFIDVGFGILNFNISDEPSNCYIKNANVNIDLWVPGCDDYDPIIGFNDLILEGGSYIASPQSVKYIDGHIIDSDGNYVSEVCIRINKEHPVITQQPEDYSAYDGYTAKFTVAARPADETIETPKFSYQWQYYDNTTQKWVDSTRSTAKQPTLKVTSDLAHDGFQYRCVITSPNGSSTVSDPAVLHYKSGIKEQPKDYSGAIGTNAKFTVGFSALGTPSYQWQYYSTSEEKWKNSGMTGANTATLTVPITEARDGQKYRCIITDILSDGGAQSFTSNTVTLNATIGFTKQPTSVTQAIGTKANFTATASGKGTISYQWQYYSKSAGEWKNSGLSSAKTSTLSVTVSETSDGQKYRCIATSSDGKKAISNTVTIKVAAAITKQPANATGAVGSDAKFSVTASGAGTLSYQWQYYDKTKSTWKDSGMTGAKTTTITVPVTEARNGQKYRCVVTSSNGTTVTSSTATLTVKATAPAITKQPANASGAVGSKVSFSVTASGTGTLSYQWQYYSKSAGEWKNSGLSSAKTSTLSVTVSATNDGMQYRCIVKSANGTSVTSSVAKLTVKAAITKQPANASGAVGSDAKFSVTASGAGTLSYQWQYYDKTKSEWKDSGMTGAKTATITVPVTAARNGQKYRCIVTSSNGTTVTSSTAILTVK